MALTGNLSDLSLSELIEFFCNQRKTGRLKVLYPHGSGYFFLQSGSVIDAKIGVLRGIDAVYYALTLSNAKFEFTASTEATERTINQPWTQVVLEGLRRLDEGITPIEAFPAGYADKEEILEIEAEEPFQVEPDRALTPTFLSFMAKDALSRRKPFIASGVAIAVLASIAAAGVPAGWYGRTATPPPVAASQTTVSAAPVPEVSETPASTSTVEAPVAADDAAALAAKRQREKDRTKRVAALGNAAVKSSPTAPAPGTAGPKKVTVTVVYDESGRVTQASGGDPTALRIARQKRFPPGKAGSATVTIPIN